MARVGESDDARRLTPERNQQVRSAVHALTGSADRARRAVGRRLEVGDTELVALALLRRTGPMQPKAVGADLRLTTSAVTAVLDRLQAAGLAERTANPLDRRSLLVRITPAGETMLQRAAASTALPLQIALDSMLAAGSLHQEDLVTTLQVMRLLAEALQQVAAEVDEDV